MTDFHADLHDQLVLATGKTNRLRYARSPLPRAETALTAAVGVVVLLACAALLGPVRPDASQQAAGQASYLEVPLERAGATGSVRLADFRGRTTLVSFTASWCTPCRENDARLALAAGRGVQIVVISHRDTADAARASAALLSSATVVNDDGERIFQALEAEGVPESFELDPDGAVTRRWRGVLTNQDVDDLVAATATGPPSTP